MSPGGEDRPAIDADLAARLVRGQFPQWAHLPVRPVAAQGWDNRTFRLGAELAVRLPSAAAYAAQVEKEQAWLPKLAPALPLAIPQPVARGAPAESYPWAWSVYRWIEGEPAGDLDGAAMSGLAHDLARFLRALRAADARGGPAPGAHNFFRGGDLGVYDAEARQAIGRLGGGHCARAADTAWERALSTRWEAPPVWVHGDVAAGNLLLREGRLAAVIDFGALAVGDPACDLTIAWTLLRGGARGVFVSATGLDAATWERARGWALWKALILFTGLVAAPPSAAADAERVLTAVLSDAS